MISTKTITRDEFRALARDLVWERRLPDREVYFEAFRALIHAFAACRSESPDLLCRFAITLLQEELAKRAADEQVAPKKPRKRLPN
jgi:hypothetical protein